MSANILVITLTGNAFAKVAISQVGARPGEAERFACRSEAQFFAGIDAFLERSGRPLLVGAAISAAGFETRGRIDLPTYGFSLQREATRAALGLQRVNLVNDAVARALAVPHLKASEFTQINGAEWDADRTRAVIGAYIGLGVAALTPDGLGDWIALPTEGGHADLASVGDFEIQVIERLRHAFGRASRETAISVPGVAHVWRAVRELRGETGDDLAAVQIVDKARAGDAVARTVIDLCVGWFGAMASDTALVLGARGGVYLIGMLIDLLGDQFDWTLFRDRFTDKGRLSDYLAAIPLFRILAPDIDLIGLATLFD